MLFSGNLLTSNFLPCMIVMAPLYSLFAVLFVLLSLGTHRTDVVSGREGRHSANCTDCTVVDAPPLRGGEVFSPGRDHLTIANLNLCFQHCSIRPCAKLFDTEQNLFSESWVLVVTS